MIPRHLLITLAVLLAAVFGLGFYLLHLKRRAEENRATDTRPVAAPVSGTRMRVALYLADDASGTLRERDQQVTLPPEPSLRARPGPRLGGGVSPLAHLGAPAAPHPAAGHPVKVPGARK